MSQDIRGKSSSHIKATSIVPEMRSYRKDLYLNAFEKDTVLVWKINIIFKYVNV